MINILKLTTKITAIGLFACGSIFAQTNATPQIPPQTKQQRVEKHIQMMKQRLSITDDQASKIAEVLKSQRETMKANRLAMQNAPDDQKAAARLKMKQDRLATREKILSMLTPDQKVKAEELRKEKMSKMKKHWKNHSMKKHSMKERKK